MNAQSHVEKLQQAVEHHRSGELLRAVRMYAEILAEDPQNADAWHLTGLVNFARGGLEESETQIRHAVSIRPEVEFQANLAAVLVGQKKSTDAENTCREILRVDGSHHAALTHLGTALRQQKRLGESLETFQRADSVQSNATSLCNLGSVLMDLGQFDAARDVLRKAHELAPQKAQVILNLAIAERELGHTDTAAILMDKAAELLPDQAEVYINRGNLFLETHRIPEAVAEYQQALRIDPRAATAASRLGRALELLDEWEAATQCHQVACTLEPDNQSFASSRLYSSCLNPRLTPDESADEHRRWGKRLEATVSVMPHQNDLVRDRVLRIGYVSPDIRNHATMRFLYPLLRGHDRSRFHVSVYSETTREDTTTEAVREIVDGWCHTKPLSDDQLAAKIRADRIDVLIDLAGHTVENRLAVFARKPSPVQVTFLGYAGTTGLSRIDYLLTDHIREPNGGKGLYTEQPFMMPNGACCFEVTNSPDVSAPPIQRNGHITLGSTHRAEKISSEAISVWVAALNAIPDARLLIVRDAFKSESLRTQVASRLIAAGLDQQRFSFQWELPESHLDIYSQIDVLLDVFPWGSGTTAYESMWMGVPVPTILGDRGACRATASMMHFCGLPELAATNTDEYVRIARGLADNPQQLAELRQTIRPAMLRTVCNGDQFARDIEAAYNTFWNLYVDSVVTPEEAVA